MTPAEAQRTRPFAIVILGPGAVGKMTVGKALSRRTGFVLFHNHVVSDMILPFFGRQDAVFGSLTNRITRLLVAEILRADPAGIVLTRAHDFDDQGDAETMTMLLSLLRDREVAFVELRASLETRLARNRMPDRLAAKPSKRDLVDSERRLRDNDRRSFSPPDGVLPWPGRFLCIDNTELDPDEVVDRIVSDLQVMP